MLGSGHSSSGLAPAPFSAERIDGDDFHMRHEQAPSVPAGTHVERASETLSRASDTRQTHHFE